MTSRPWGTPSDRATVTHFAFRSMNTGFSILYSVMLSKAPIPLRIIMSALSKSNSTLPSPTSPWHLSLSSRHWNRLLAPHAVSKHQSQIRRRQRKSFALISLPGHLTGNRNSNPMTTFAPKKAWSYLKLCKRTRSVTPNPRLRTFSKHYKLPSTLSWRRRRTRRRAPRR